jgi:DNA-binding NarL/FixJ family response regulator
MTHLIRVFLVEDHELFASGVRSELGGGFDLVGHARSVEDAVTGITETEPDVVLLDVHLPDGSGASVVERCPGVRFLAVSVSDAAEDVILVIRAGARGYVTKSISEARRVRPRRVRRGGGSADRSGARPSHPA